MFGYIFIAIILQTIIISLMCIISTYLSLCNQDYEWWWKSFVVGASGSIFLAIQNIGKFYNRFDTSDLYSNAIFALYLTVFMIFYIFITGYIGVLSSYKFINLLYRT